ncbi:MAG: DUF362 domain-containing protein [Methanophagales archaeon]|nr:DUF362 domain-containing protein [Methanophagales archaeon]
MSEVYFVAADKNKNKNVRFSLVEKLERLLKKAGCSNLSGIVALKMHMGELKNKTFIKPVYVKKMVDVVKQHGGDPFVTDTTTIYRAGRYTAMDYYRTASAHGFHISYLGCPVIIADGLKDEGVQVNEQVEIARMIYNSDSMLIVSHATGHGASSFGGAIKNVAMGCVTKRTKLYQHEVTRPVRNPELCSRCDRCRVACKHDAIDDDHEIILENCVSCGACMSECETGALRPPEGMSTDLQKRLAEVAHTVLRNLPYSDSNLLYLNFLIDITPFCDCAEFAPEYLCPDIGILASNDIVAIDMATIDMIGTHLFKGDPTIQVREAHALGIGAMEYDLIDLELESGAGNQKSDW